jgi:hypothetical protein
MSDARAQLSQAFSAALAADAKGAFGLDLETLKAALAKVKRRKLQADNDREPFTQSEIDALSAWMNLQILAEGSQTRAECSERNKAAWSAGDRRKWAGELRKRDKRRGWRNFSGGR